MALPPGPRAPRAIQMYQWVADPIPYLAHGAEKYGPMFTARFSIGDLVFISDPGADQGGLPRRPRRLHAGEANAPPLEPIVGRNSVLLLDGPEHMRQRKLMLPSFHGERMRRYGDLMRADRARRHRPLAGRHAVRAARPHAGDHARGDHAHGLRDRGRRPARPAARHRSAGCSTSGNHRFAMTAIVLPQLRRTVGRADLAPVRRAARRRRTS